MPIFDPPKASDKKRRTQSTGRTAPMTKRERREFTQGEGMSAIVKLGELGEEMSNMLALNGMKDDGIVYYPGNELLSAAGWVENETGPELNVDHMRWLEEGRHVHWRNQPDAQTYKNMVNFFLQPNIMNDYIQKIGIYKTVFKRNIGSHFNDHDAHDKINDYWNWLSRQVNYHFRHLSEVRDHRGWIALEEVFNAIDFHGPKRDRADQWHENRGKDWIYAFSNMLEVFFCGLEDRVQLAVVQVKVKADGEKLPQKRNQRSLSALCASVTGTFVPNG